MSLILKRVVRLSKSLHIPARSVPTGLPAHRYLHCSPSSCQKRSWADRITEEIEETEFVQEPLNDAKKFQDRGFAELNTQSTSRDRNETSGTKWSSSFRVFNLPETATKNDLRRLFEEFGEVKDVRLSNVGSRTATVTFEDPTTADKAMHAHQESPLILDNNTLALRYGASTRLNPESNTLFVSNFSNSSEDHIREIFGTLGPIKAIRFGKERKVCFVEFDNTDTARTIVEQHERVALRDGLRLLRINYARSESNPKYEEPHHTICVSGYQGDPNALETYFEKYDGGNHILSIRIAQTDTERPPLYFVTFEDVTYATRAVEYVRNSNNLGFNAAYARPAKKTQKNVQRRPRRDRR